MKQKILIIGSGGREHAIGWKLLQSPRVEQLYFAPGNGGTEKIGINVPIEAKDIDGLLDFAKKEKIDVTLAIPDDPLALGIVDLFQSEGLRIFGPSQEAAQLESSKAFAKKFMAYHNLPTARFETFTDLEEARAYIEVRELPLVIKASGLALGKGVFICYTKEEIEEALHEIMVKKTFGHAGEEIVVEEYLEGVEISTHAFTDGNTYVMFPTSQDHKRIGEGDTGPNTGGMGTIAPLAIVTPKLFAEIGETVIGPTLSAMFSDNMPFRGVIYPGLMLTENGSKILEFNARFGDPETQTYMRLLETDLLDIIDACIDGTLEQVDVHWKPMSACTIILASSGYPGPYKKGFPIKGIVLAEQDPNVVVFQAGTAFKDDFLVTNGGRVLGVSAIGNSIQEALASAYTAIEQIHFEGMYYRRDIGKKILTMENEKYSLH